VSDRRKLRRDLRHCRNAAPESARRNRAPSRSAWRLAVGKRKGAACPRRVRGRHRVEERQAHLRDGTIAPRKRPHVALRAVHARCASRSGSIAGVEANRTVLNGDPRAASPRSLRGVVGNLIDRTYRLVLAWAAWRLRYAMRNA